MNVINVPPRVVATKQHVDEGRLFAQLGDVGDVLDAEQTDDGELVLLTVVLPNAPCATTVALFVDCEPFPKAARA